MHPFDVAMAFTLRAEGGFVDDPHDHGGATNHGITQASYDAWRAHHGMPSQSVELLTDAETRQLYDEDYWTPAKCPQLPAALAVIHFDWCVNHGVSGAIKTLQRALGVSVDGIFGPGTAAAVAVAAADLGTLIREYQAFRIAFYHADVEADPSQARFLPGWLKRVDQLNAFLTEQGLMP